MIGERLLVVRGHVDQGEFFFFFSCRLIKTSSNLGDRLVVVVYPVEIYNAADVASVALRFRDSDCRCCCCRLGKTPRTSVTACFSCMDVFVEVVGGEVSPVVVV